MSKKGWYLLRTKERKQVSLKKKFLLNISFAFCGTFLIFSILMALQVFRELKEEKTIQNRMYMEMLANQIVESIDKYKAVVETVALQQQVKTLDYTQIEPYFKEFLTKENRTVWSHFIICNQYGTEQAHSEGYSGHGYSIKRDPSFKVPFETGQTYVGSPGISISTKRAVMGIGVPIIRDGRTVGVVNGYVWLEHISKLINSYSLTDNSYVFLLNEEGILCAHPDSTRVFKENWIQDDNVSKEINLVANEMVNGNTGSKVLKENGVYNCYTYQQIGNTKLSLCVVSPVSELYQIAISTLVFLIITIVVFTIVCVTFSVLMVSNVIYPIKWMEEQMYRFSEGIMSVMDKKIKYKNTKEMAAFYRAVTTLSKTLQSMTNRLADESVVLMGSAQIVSERMSDTNKHVGDVTIYIDNFNKTTLEVQENIENLNKSSKSILNFAGSISVYATQGKEFVDTIKEDSNKVKIQMDANRENTKDSIRRITEELTILIRSSKSAQDIQELTLEIRKIAKTTKILSFNAAIEAQRAGQNGEGFCVIAQEIRNLSENTGELAKKIDGIVNVVLSAVNCMSEKSKEILAFINYNVISDYENFNDIITDNVKHANDISDIMDHFSKHAFCLEQEIAESTGEIQNISDHTSTNNGDLEMIIYNMRELIHEMDQIREETVVTEESAKRLKAEIVAYIK